MDELYCQNCHLEVSEENSHCKCCGHDLPTPSKGSYYNPEQWFSQNSPNIKEKNRHEYIDYPKLSVVLQPNVNIH
jgi:hypothetical protein